MTSLSIDLAVASYRSFGVCLLRGGASAPWGLELLEPRALGLRGEPEPEACAAALAAFSRREGVEALLLDGPQGWKDPRSGLPLCRASERELNCPARTGLEGQVKPGGYRRFVEFSIRLFTVLHRRFGMPLLSRSLPPARGETLLLESFPAAAWRGLGLSPLSSRARRSPETLLAQARLLEERLELRTPPGLSHDQLQALVGGLAGPAFLGRFEPRPPGRSLACRLAGRDPLLAGGGPALEGLIAVPVLEVLGEAGAAGPD